MTNFGYFIASPCCETDCSCGELKVLSLLSSKPPPFTKTLILSPRIVFDVLLYDFSVLKGNSVSPESLNYTYKIKEVVY